MAEMRGIRMQHETRADWQRMVHQAADFVWESLDARQGFEP